MNGLNIYFSDFFNVDEDIIDTYGAVNVSLKMICPSLLNPLLLCNSEKPKHQQIHLS